MKQRCNELTTMGNEEMNKGIEVECGAKRARYIVPYKCGEMAVLASRIVRQRGLG